MMVCYLAPTQWVKISQARMETLPDEFEFDDVPIEMRIWVISHSNVYQWVTH
jgi:hypothetical protein